MDTKMPPLFPTSTFTSVRCLSHAPLGFTSLRSPHGLLTTPGQCHGEMYGEDPGRGIRHDPAKRSFVIAVAVWVNL
jgi:hypothetical protein